MICPNCGKEATFTPHAHSWTETHGLDCGPYERCYQEWLTCDECGAVGDYILWNDPPHARRAALYTAGDAMRVLFEATFVFVANVLVLVAFFKDRPELVGLAYLFLAVGYVLKPRCGWTR